MKFGVFDHVDDSGLPLAEHLENRLRMAEAYDEAGIYCYHVAEHHGTPLGLAPSPGILFAALSQRTQQLRFGPLVYLLPLYAVATSYEQSLFNELTSTEEGARYFEEVDAYFAALPADRFPHMAALAPELAEGDPGERFEFGLDIFDRLAQLLLGGHEVLGRVDVGLRPLDQDLAG